MKYEKFEVDVDVSVNLQQKYLATEESLEIKSY